MSDEPIATYDFLLACLQYEYFKNPENPGQVHKNISEMMISEEARRWKVNDESPEESSEEFSSEGTRSSGSMSTDTLSNSISLSSRSSGESTSSPTSSGGPVPVPRPYRYPQRTPSEENPRNSADSNFDHYAQDLPSEFPMDPLPAVFTRDALLKEEEDDDLVDGVSLAMILEVFDNFEKGYDMPPIEKSKVRLSVLRKWAFTFVWITLPTSGDEQQVHPFHHLKTVTDHSKIKIYLTSCTEPFKNLKLEYWETTKGCMIWYQNSVRLIEDFDFELLAASEFIEIIKYSLGLEPRRILNDLEFDMEEKSKWSPKEYHSVEFTRKFKRFVKREQKSIHTRQYSMKLYRFKKCILAMPMEFLEPKRLEGIKVRLWNDSHIQLNDRQTPNCLSRLDRTEQWKNAKFLDIEDPYLVGFIPNITAFLKVRMWSVTTPQGLEDLRNMFDEHLPARITVTVKKGITEELRAFGIVLK